MTVVTPLRPHADDGLHGLRDLLAQRSRWIGAVAFDRRLTDSQARIAIAYATKHLNRDVSNSRFGLLWASAGTVADELGVGKRTVVRTFEQLRAIGYLEVVDLGAHSAAHRIAFPLLPAFSGHHRKRRPGRPSRAASGAAAAPPAAHPYAASGAAAAPPAAHDSEREDTGGTHRVLRGSERDALIIDQERNQIGVAEVLDDFEVAWSAYRHRPDDRKTLARRAWDELLRQGINPAVVIAAAERQATTISAPRYAVHMHRWLAGREFEDQQSAEPFAWLGSDGPGSAVAAAQAALAADPLRSTYGNDNPASPDWKWSGHTFDEWREKLAEYRRRRDEGARMAVWFEIAPGWGLPPKNKASRAPPQLRRELGFD